jgi:hypothetical protein
MRTATPSMIRVKIMSDDIVVTLDNNPGLLLQIERLEKENDKLKSSNYDLTIEVKVLERMLSRLSNGRYE